MASFLIHRVTQADTLRGLAKRYLGDHKEWVQLVTFNELQPEQYDLWGAGVRELRIPINTGPGEGDQDPYLTDLAVDADGGLVLAPGGGLATVSGVPNVISSLVRALTTDLGQLMPHPQYGMELDRLVGVAGSGFFLPLVKSEVRRVITRDPRVAEVRDLKVTQLAGLRQVAITGKVSLVGSSDTFEFYVDREIG